MGLPRLPLFSEFKHLVTTEFPTAINKYRAMKNGEVKTFDSYREAKMFSPLIEEVFVNRDEYAKQLEQYYAQDALRNAAFKAACREHFAEVNDEVFELCWDYSSTEHHSHGYDEIANGLYDIVDFAERVVSAARRG